MYELCALCFCGLGQIVLAVSALTTDYDHDYL